jgi:alkanesulfonate monooxygenase SsuD/methylene tetrahydromethanopterin reductase-like flavin-dependent oxidoreductase (luciferase family)
MTGRHLALPDGSIDKETTPVLGSPNRLKLAVFSANMAGGANLTTHPDAPRVTWAETVRIARAAEAAGFESLIPVARWRGMADARRREAHRSFDTFTWAAGLAAVTERIQVFATYHVPVVHPVAAAKQIATVDHISGGRFGLNVVAGWNVEEFRMFGIEPREHDDRYAVADEWMRFLGQIHAARTEIDFAGDYFSGYGVLSEPRPVQRPGPVVMNAGFSPAGREFAARHADLTFALLPSAEQAKQAVESIKTDALERQGRDLKVFAGAHIVCAPSEAAAREDLARMVEEYGDLEAARTAIRLLIPDSQSAAFDADAMAASAITGFFALPLVGTPEQVVDQMRELSDAGVDGLALSWLDYEAGLDQYASDLQPLLVRAGLRQ